jgi:hypothetical protein
MANCSSSALRSLSPASRSTWSSDTGRLPKDGAPSCVTTHPTSRPWTYSLPRPLVSTCSMPSSSSGWLAETSSGSTSHLIQPLNGLHVRSLKHFLGMRPRATCSVIGIGSTALSSCTDCEPLAFVTGPSPRLALAERLHRKADRIYPTRVRRPRDPRGRSAPTQDSASLCPLLQRCENAPIIGQGRALLAPGSADRTHRVACAPRRASSPLLQDLGFRHTQRRNLHHPRRSLGKQWHLCCGDQQQ